MTELRIAALAVALLAAPHAARAQPAAIAAPAPASFGTAAIAELRARGLEVPVRGIAPNQLRDTYDSRRSGARRHHAIDILAPRETPVVAVEDGRIRRLSLANGGGGIAIYQVDPSDGFVYYYAVLEPWLAFAKLRKDCVSFLGCSVLEMTQKTFDRYRGCDWKQRLRGDDPKVSYMNQYNETDYAFMSKLYPRPGKSAASYTSWQDEATGVARAMNGAQATRDEDNDWDPSDDVRTTDALTEIEVGA